MVKRGRTPTILPTLGHWLISSRPPWPHSCTGPGDDAAVTGSVVLESAATGSAVPLHRPMHPANVQYVRTMAHRILSALTPCIRPGRHEGKSRAPRNGQRFQFSAGRRFYGCMTPVPFLTPFPNAAPLPCCRLPQSGLDLSEFLVDLEEAATRPDLSRLFRKLDRAIDHVSAAPPGCGARRIQGWCIHSRMKAPVTRRCEFARLTSVVVAVGTQRLMSAHWQSTRPSRVSDLSRPDAHLTTFVRYLKALWREMPPK